MTDKSNKNTKKVENKPIKKTKSKIKTKRELKIEVQPKIIVSDEVKEVKPSIPKEIEEEVKALVKVEVFKQNANAIKGINELDSQIITDYVNGFTDSEIIDKHKIDSNYLTCLLATPAYATEIKKRIYETGFTNKDNLLRANARIGQELYEMFLLKLQTDPNSFLDMPADRFLKSLKETMELSHKLVEGNKIKVETDICQLIQQHISNKKRVKSSNETELIIENEFPEYDADNDVVIGEWKEIE